MFACPHCPPSAGWAPVAGRCRVLLMDHPVAREGVVLGMWQGQALNPAAVCGQLVCGRCGRCQSAMKGAA